MGTYLIGALTLAFLYIIRRWLEYRGLLRIIRDFPGHRTLLKGFSPMLRWRIPYICPGSDSDIYRKYQDFAECGHDVMAWVNMFPRARVAYDIADAECLKEIVNARAHFVKPVYMYRMLSFFGSNLLITEGYEWKRQRKVVAPVFSERNNKLIWDETIRIVGDLFDNVWGNNERVDVDHAVDITLPLALFVLSGAAFGKPVSWTQGSSVPLGHTMAFKDALHVVSTQIELKMIFPSWALRWGITLKLRKFQQAYEEFSSYMSDMIRERKSDAEKAGGADILSSLVQANEEEFDGDSKLNQGELEGNTFIFLLAGHETTAHSLAFTFGLLALYPDEQEKYYQHLKEYLADGRTPGYEEMGQLTYSLAVLYEALRMYPTTKRVPKVSTEDTTLSTINAGGQKVVIPVPKGTELFTSAFGMHYNPRYWPDPDTYKPARFLGDYNRDAFVPFSVGARACIGRKFTETESVAALTMIIMRYKIELKDEPQFAGESFEQKKARLFTVNSGVTLAPRRLPLVFKRRSLL
ncbi:cytochrome P450 [Sparassis latifolia]